MVGYGYFLELPISKHNPDFTISKIHLKKLFSCATSHTHFYSMVVFMIKLMGGYGPTLCANLGKLFCLIWESTN